MNQQQIARIWNNQMSREEKKAFLENLLQHEATWKALLEAEYKKELTEDAQHLSEDRVAIILQRMHETIGQSPKNKTITLQPLFKWMVAAAVLVIMGTLFYQYKMRRLTHAIAQTDKPKAMLTLQTNYTTANRQLQLEDGSIITLAPGAAVRYYAPFVNNKRDISLEGQAWFTVAKYNVRPFTVYAGNITTTALGTIFMIDTRVTNKMEVRLYEGKVVIRPADTSITMQDVYLKPGELFNLDQQKKQYAVHLIDENAVAAQQSKNKPAEKAVAIQIKPLEFTQQPLQDVLTEIGKRYKVQFVYDTIAIADIQVTGKFLPSDALQTVLSMLGTVNDLSFTVRQNTISVSKLK